MMKAQTPSSCNKKDGGIIKDWSLHTLSTGQQLMTGIVVKDPTGRFEEGWTMRSSLVVNVDREKGIVETENTFYSVENEIDWDIGSAILGMYF